MQTMNLEAAPAPGRNASRTAIANALSPLFPAASAGRFLSVTGKAAPCAIFICLLLGAVGSLSAEPMIGNALGQAAYLGHVILWPAIAMQIGIPAAAMLLKRNATPDLPRWLAWIWISIAAVTVVYWLKLTGVLASASPGIAANVGPLIICYLWLALLTAHSAPANDPDRLSAPALSRDRPALDCFSERYLAAWNERRIESMNALLAARFHWSEPCFATPLSKVAHVHEYMESAWKTLPDLQFDALGHPLVDPDQRRVAFAWRMRAHLDGAGPNADEEMSLICVGVFTLDEAHRAVRIRVIHDALSHARQLGLTS